MSHEIAFSPEAVANLLALYDYIATRGGTDRAAAYTDRIETACLGLRTFPERGIRRDDLRPGLRLLGFERRITIAFQIASDTVTVLGILYGGQAVEAAFGQPGEI